MKMKTVFIKEFEMEIVDAERAAFDSFAQCFEEAREASG
jgi:hypothetical protein